MFRIEVCWTRSVTDYSELSLLEIFLFDVPIGFVSIITVSAMTRIARAAIYGCGMPSGVIRFESVNGDAA